ncbi:MAG: glutamyl-tRNA reductase [Gemmatimonadota bacterium]|nr:glutamyl-tRNA reductase [Gemmatimonadota bacterium]
MSRPRDLVVTGLSHRTAPIELRERYELSGERLRRWAARIADLDEVAECVVLSTCNRTECYATGPSGSDVAVAVRAELDRAAGLPRGQARFFNLEGYDAVRHLFRVTSGLDSLVIGEAQIQGQVANAYERAGTEVLGPVLHRLFQSALAAGGRVRATTSISRGAASIPSAAVELARKVYGSLAGRSVLVAGTGEMGRLTVRCLRGEGVQRVFLASRHRGRAERVGRELDAIPVDREAIWGLMREVDLLVTATDAEAAFVTGNRLAAAHDDSRKVVVLDIAVPRNVEETVSVLPGVFLYNVDDLQRVVDQTLSARRFENDGAEAIIEHHAGRYWVWHRTRMAAPLIRGMREAAHRILAADLEARLPAGPRDVDRTEELRLASRTLLNKILHGPTQALRRLAEQTEDEREFQEFAAHFFEPGDTWESSRTARNGLG